ncbi:MAG: hypothetical protein DYG96_03090, partial [Chlorobi bacterium CHB2]|nr:hypothetical protein [Chlorobi bacterium CHB2]
MKTNTKTSLLLLITTAAVLLAHATTLAQPNTWIDPRHPSVAWLQEWGYMTGTGLPCKPTWGEEFGRGIIPVGDVNGDAIADFILERSRCDTLFGPSKAERANELLLYFGDKGRLPIPASGQRLGSSELGTLTRFLCAADFDDDSFVDFALRIEKLNDSAYNANGQYSIASLVIFWGNSTHRYTEQDTSHLTCYSDTWLGICRALFIDINNDNHKDLLISTCGGYGFTNGKVVRQPVHLVYFGQQGKRWGKTGQSTAADMLWWTTPAYEQTIDQDCDGRIDLVSTQQQKSIRIQYGSEQGLQDTTAVETIDLSNSGAHSALFQDVTGDKVPDLIVRGGDFEQGRIRIFAGAPGQRLTELYGNGNDSADRANHRFPLRPWAQILSPNALHEGWFDWDNELFDLGDLNEDGTSEIVAFSKPFILCYTTGNTLDSLIDIMFNVPGDSWATIRRIGDVDGSRTVSYAITFDEKVHFLKAPP